MIWGWPAWGGAIPFGYKEPMSPLDGVGLSDVGEALKPVELLDLLPDAYAAVLREANGFTINHGTNRIFGLRADRHMDLRAWNDEDGWRFAWGGLADPFLCFGETVFGDQYALRWRPGRDGFEPEVYLLDANLLGPDVVADSFDDFLAKEIVRNSRTPHDPLAVAAVAAFGRVEPTHNLVLTPSVMLGGPEVVDNLMPLDAFAAMIYGGDIHTAVSALTEDATVSAVEPWFDELERPRLRVVFSE
jgi:hypothetical protein